MNGAAVESAAQDGTTPGAGLSKLIPIVLKSFPQKPSVFVLITCFNYGTYVGKAIESALEQTYPRQKSSSATMHRKTTPARWLNPI
jgi:hypothetical protein